MNTQFIEEVTKRVVEHMKSALIPVEASARHIHLSAEDQEALFGRAPLIRKKELSQPGQFQYEERVRLIGPKGILSGVAILGPARNKTQVEISQTDAIALGISPPVRDSGDLEESGSVFVASEKGMILAEEGVIIARRHIHMSDEDAAFFQVADGELVKVRVFGLRPVIFEDVLIRVNKNYRLALHIDLDEANASGCKASTFCSMIKV